MSSEMYPRGLQGFLNNDYKWGATGANFKVWMLTSAAAAYASTDEDLADVSASDLYTGGLTGNLASLTNTGGVADAANVTITSFAPSGSLLVEDMLLHYATGSSATAILLAFYSNASTTGLPLDPNGGDVTIQWHASGCFKLSSL